MVALIGMENRLGLGDTGIRGVLASCEAPCRMIIPFFTSGYLPSIHGVVELPQGACGYKVKRDTRSLISSVRFVREIRALYEFLNEMRPSRLKHSGRAYESER